MCDFWFEFIGVAPESQQGWLVRDLVVAFTRYRPGAARFGLWSFTTARRTDHWGKRFRQTFLGCRCFARGWPGHILVEVAVGVRRVFGDFGNNCCQSAKQGLVQEAWSRGFFTHEQVGGVIEWSGTIVARNWIIPPLQDSVQRNLGHVLEQSDLPSPCSEQFDFPHLSAESLLPLKESTLPDVAFHTYASRTGWGRRQLNHKEIAGAMDLPLWFSTWSPLFDR